MIRYDVAFLTGMLLLTATASAVELDYKWKQGDVHRFQFEDSSSVDVAVGGMSQISTRMKVRTDFSMKVLRVKPGGKADIELTVERLDLFQDGRKLAALEKIPPAARKVKADIDRKGHARFYRMVTVYLRDDQVYVGIHKASIGPQGASVSASAGGPEGGVEVDVVAAVDPRTGRVTAAMNVRERPPKLKKVEIREQDPAVDILPKDILEMMVLPEGHLSPGSELEVKLPFVTTVVSLEQMSGTVATIKTRTKAAVDAPKPADDEDADEEPEGMPGMEMEGMPGMDGVPGMPDMGSLPGMDGAMPSGLPGMPGGSGGGAPAILINADVTGRFDTGAGKLLGIQGTLGTTISLGGMGQVKTTSEFVLMRR